MSNKQALISVICDTVIVTGVGFLAYHIGKREGTLKTIIDMQDVMLKAQNNLMELENKMKEEIKD